MNLRLDWCSHEAAKYAVEHWHYSRSMPAGKLVKIGAWEDGEFIGCIIFARGSNKYLGLPFGLEQTEAVELVRVALREHSEFTSRIVSIAVRMLKKFNSGLRLIVSFADPNEGHHGGIYQACNWLYIGSGSSDHRCIRYKKSGRVFHWRTVAGELSKRGLTSTVKDAERLGYKPIETIPKYKYLYPLDDAMRAQIEPLRKPYPKRGSGEIDSAPGSNRETGGARPTDPLLLVMQADSR